MEEMIKRSYLGDKFLLDNLKKEKNKILHGQFLKGYGVTPYEKSTILKTYYDTQDCFFYKVGITININKLHGNKAELVVRFNRNANRIMFLTNMPDTFAKEINPKSTISHHIDYITDAIYELIPNGINADVKELVKQTKAIMYVEKKRERYRLVNINGFKTIMSFSYCTYMSNLTNVKCKLEILELESELSCMEYFPTFQKLLVFEFPTLIKTKSSDLDVGFEVCV